MALEKMEANSFPKQDNHNRWPSQSITPRKFFATDGAVSSRKPRARLEPECRKMKDLFIYFCSDFLFLNKTDLADNIVFFAFHS